MKKKQAILVGILIVGATVLCMRAVPLGVSLVPYCIASVDEGHSIGSMPWLIVYNDAGGAHSGNFWTWIIEDRGMYRIVIAEGYSNCEVRYGHRSMPIRSEDGTLCVGFADGRYAYDGEVRWTKVDTKMTVNDVHSETIHERGVGTATHYNENDTDGDVSSGITLDLRQPGDSPRRMFDVDPVE